MIIAVFWTPIPKKSTVGVDPHLPALGKWGSKGIYIQILKENNIYHHHHHREGEVETK